MIEEKLNYFFIELKKIRKSKNISIDDICEKTKLQKEYIVAIESGNFNFLSSPHIRLFIKGYCESLGVNVHKYLKLYEEYISTKSKKSTRNETPKFIDKNNKDTTKRILEINNESSTNLNGSYFLGSKRIIVISSIILTIMISWIILANISKTNHRNHKIKFDNTKLEWTFFENLNLVDSQYVKLKKINKNNIFKYEYLNYNNKILITDPSGINVVNKVINENDEGENSIVGNVEFGILNGKIKFYVNNQKIDFNHIDKIIIGSFDIKKESILIKYYE